MTTPYIDPQFIFASDAPTQDKPPAFNNYVKGMGETRSNDGRPTIKQFNFLFQQQDFKFLYIHERGACLPFVDGFPYENNAIVFKDGFIQQKYGSSWIIPFMRGSQNLAELTDVAQARVKLDVYAKSEALSKDNNLSDVADEAEARTNLGVYSKAETDSIAGTPDATEAVAGKAKIATTAIAQEGANDTDIITAKKLRDALNASGSAPVSACRAWLSVNTVTSTILQSFNVASFVRTATGQFEITFTTPMSHQNYVAFTNSISVKGGISNNNTVGSTFNATQTNTVSRCYIWCWSTSNGSLLNPEVLNVGVFC